MITLSIDYEPPFNKLTNKSREKLKIDSEITISELFELLEEKYGKEFKELIWDKNKEGELSSFLSIIINGRSFRDEAFLSKMLKDGDDLSFLYIYFGG